MNFITVRRIIDLFFSISSFNIYVLESDDTYNFDGNFLPPELECLPVASIDDPLSYDERTPFTINISKVNFDDYDAFKEEFADNMK